MFDTSTYKYNLCTTLQGTHLLLRILVTLYNKIHRDAALCGQAMSAAPLADIRTVLDIAKQQDTIYSLHACQAFLDGGDPGVLPLAIHVRALRGLLDSCQRPIPLMNDNICNTCIRIVDEQSRNQREITDLSAMMRSQIRSRTPSHRATVRGCACPSAQVGGILEPTNPRYHRGSGGRPANRVRGRRACSSTPGPRRRPRRRPRSCPLH